MRWLLVLAVVFAGLSYSYRFGARAAERAAEQAAHQIRIDVTRRVLDPRGMASGSEMTTSPALLAMSDRVVMIDGGTITGVGCHRDLINDHERYRDLVVAV